MPFRFSTDSVPEAQRLDYWQTMCSEHIGAFQLKDYDRTDFNASLDVVEMGDVKVGRFQGASQTFEQRERSKRASKPDDYIIVLGSDHTIHIENGENKRSYRGGLLLVDIAQPYTTAYPEHLDVIDLFVPRKLLETVLGPANLAAGLRIDSNQSSFHAISALLNALAAHGANLEPETAARFGRIAIDLVAVGFSERMALEPSRNLSGASILFRAKACIDDHLEIPGLDMARIASAMNISVRRLHQVATEAGVSLTDWMWDRRLLRAHERLIDRAHKSLTISSIAYACGFTDQAHFSRRFKERFGLTPSEHRRLATLDHEQ